MNERHGHTTDGQPRLYRIWRAMRFRCGNTGHVSYPRYGGRGITVCSEWDRSFSVFYAWAMENGYADDLSIDRIDNDGDYTPTNCRWTTAAQQLENKSSRCQVEVNGVTKSVCAWGKETGIHLTTLYRRYRKGIRGAAFLAKPIPKAEAASTRSSAQLRCEPST